MVTEEKAAAEEAARVRHPLDPLTPAEISTTAQVIKDAGHWGPGFRFIQITLEDPPKERVLAFRPGGPIVRRAFAILHDKAERKVFEAVVSLDDRRLVSFTHIPDVQPYFPFEDLFPAIDAIKADARWQDAMRRRGVTDFELVQIDPWPAGNFGFADEKGRRLARGISYWRESETDNGYAHPIEGVVALVDLDTCEVVRVTEDAVLPIPKEHGNYGPAQVGELRTDIKPLEIVQPEGPSFTIEGNELRWQKWRMHVSMHPRDGLVLHQVGYEDQGRLRSVMYRASLGEMVVPYGDAGPGQFWKNAFDSGEFGLGRMANSLELGCDCLGEIRYLDATYIDAEGSPIERKNVICIHEEDFGVLWKHSNRMVGINEVRRNRRLVVSFIATVGNYDYGFYWYFYQDGSIQMEVKMTGILQTMAVPDGGAPGYGTLVAPNLAGANHQHFFCFRLDMDVDGTKNCVYEFSTGGQPRGDANPYGNVFTGNARLLRSEKEAQREVDPLSGRRWRVANPEVKNRLGQPVAYDLFPGEVVAMMAAPDSAIAARAGFARKQFWATQYAPRELYAAGDYVNQHPGGAGLPAYTAGDRNLEGEDVVIWYTVGANHVPRPEDWPVMPVHPAGFMLRPNGFFDRNPALDVPPPPMDHCHQ